MLYERPRLNSADNGRGMRPRSTKPTTTSDSHPSQHSLAPRVHETEQQNENEHAHLHQTEGAIALELRRPWEDEHGFHVEHHEQQRKDVVTHLALRPAFPYRVDTALIRQEFLVARSRRTHHRRHPKQQASECHGDEPKPPDRQIRPQELRGCRHREKTTTRLLLQETSRRGVM